ncbi:MAG: PHP domain-containing protein [Desulfobacterales bacterium]|nr:PHP domain-containing protein [Desulfobacterales bacterium]
MEYKSDTSVDLHIHSTASDGTLTPAQLLAMAVQLNLGAIAITDHDSIAGSREALLEGIPAALGFLTGVEISAEPPPSYPGSGSIHVLGYAIRLDDPELNRALEKLQEARKSRNPEIVDRLKRLGIEISLEEVEREAGEGQAGRPHIATLLVKKGVAASIDDAFDRFLSSGRPGYADKFRIECSQAITLINAAGGIPVLAHPCLLELETEDQLEELLQEMIAMGLKGLEVFFTDHTADQTRRFAALARRHELIMTGGTDFHGETLPNVRMGTGKGNLHVPYALYERLIER